MNHLDPNFQRLMQEATRLTQGGNLQAATAAIQSALGGSAIDVNKAWSTDGLSIFDRVRDVIDVEAREVGERTAPDAAKPMTSAPSAASGSGPRFIAGSHIDPAAGTREYKLFIPSAAASSDTPLPLVVMLHGCTQNPDDFAAGTQMNAAAEAQGLFVLYPSQSQRANPQRCWNWFKHSHQKRGRGEAALLAGMTQAVMEGHAIDRRRVYVAGLSAGGAMAAILGREYPDLYAAVGVHSGLAAGAASDLPSAMAAMGSGGGKAPAVGSGTPTIVFHGDADATVHPRNAEHVVAASAGHASAVEVDRRQGQGGRPHTRHVHRAADGRVLAESWTVHGAPHAWAGGSAKGSFTDRRGPDATAEMLRFFMEHPRPAAH